MDVGKFISKILINMNSKLIVQTISYLLKIVIIILLFISIIKNDYLWTFFIILMVLISFIPNLIRFFTKIHLFYLLDIFIALSLIFHTGNGLFNGCDIHPIYNKFTHFFSSIVVAFIIFIILTVISEDIKKQRTKILIDVVLYTMAFGVIWEFLEWLTDYFFNWNSQLGLFDTMGDLLSDTLGGIFMIILGLFLIKSKFLEKMKKDIKKILD